MFGREGDGAERFGSSVVVDRDAFDDVQARGGDVDIGFPWWLVIGIAFVALAMGLGMATGKIPTPGKEGASTKGGNNKN